MGGLLGHISSLASFENVLVSPSGTIFASCLTARRMQSAVGPSLGCFAIRRGRRGLPPRTSQAHRTVHFHGTPSDPNDLHGLGVSLYFKLQA